MATSGPATTRLRHNEAEPPAALAGKILAAASSWDLARLEAGLARVESFDRRSGAHSGLAEQAELLSSVAARMRSAIEGFRRDLSPPLRGAETHLRLLKHLAQSSARFL